MLCGGRAGRKDNGNEGLISYYELPKYKGTFTFTREGGVGGVILSCPWEAGVELGKSGGSLEVPPTGGEILGDSVKKGFRRGM